MVYLLPWYPSQDILKDSILGVVRHLRVLRKTAPSKLGFEHEVSFEEKRGMSGRRTYCQALPEAETCLREAQALQLLYRRAFCPSPWAKTSIASPSSTSQAKPMQT